VLVGGRILVSGGRSVTLSVATVVGARTEVQVGTDKLEIRGGRIGALLAEERTRLPGMTADLDALARTLALELNRVHSTGVPGNGPFQSLVSHDGVEDTNGNGRRGDELIGSANLPFDVTAGELWVAVTNRKTGDVERTELSIDPASMTLDELASAIGAIDHLTASVDPVGRLRIQAANGYGFDFAARLDPKPDTFGSFGGQKPVLGNTGTGPFDLSGAAFPQTFTVSVDGSPTTVTLNASDFVSPGAATVDELVEAINDDLTNATAKNVGGRLVIRSSTGGAAATLALADGSGGPLARLGMALGPVTGQDRGVEVAITGSYAGANDRFVFVPDGDGEIGKTPGLTVSVYDSKGLLVTTLAVGAGYAGDELEVTDGIRVSFGNGAISRSANQVFALDALADSDTTDLLVALGMNPMFVGHSAATLAVNPELERDPGLLAAGLQDAKGDAGNVLRMLGLRGGTFAALGGASFEEFFADLVGSLGFDVATATTTLESASTTMAYLEEQRLAISGVDLDEEMVDLVAYQKAYEAAARFIDTVRQMTDVLIDLGR
jgi:flagellar hook-associated protein FlgK